MEASQGGHRALRKRVTKVRKAVMAYTRPSRGCFYIFTDTPFALLWTSAHGRRQINPFGHLNNFVHTTVHVFPCSTYDE